MRVLPQVESPANPLVPFTPSHLPAPWLWPLVALDWVFERTTEHLGAFGLWLRRPTGRTLLGLSGLVLLGLAAALLVLDWFGWTR